MVTLGGIDLGVVKNESQSKDSSLFNQPMPRSDSDEAILMDLFGTSRTVTIDGVKTGTLSELRTFVNAIEGIQSGTQTGSTFSGGFKSTNITVLIQNFTWNYAEGDVSRISYTLTLVQGTAI